MEQEYTFQVVTYNPPFVVNGRVIKEGKFSRYTMPGIDNVASYVANTEVFSLINDPPEARVEIYYTTLHDDSNVRIDAENKVFDTYMSKRIELLSAISKNLSDEANRISSNGKEDPR